MKIRSKILSILITALLVLGLTASAGIFYLSRGNTRTQTEITQQLSDSTILDLITMNVQVIYSSIDSITEKALEEAALFTRLPVVQRAYTIAAEGDMNNEASPQSQEARLLLREELTPFASGYMNTMGGKQFQLHFHLPNSRSLIRLWRNGYQVTRNGEKLDVSDDLTGFRASVVQINQGNHQEIKGIEIGRGGFALRGIAPVVDQSNRHLGSVEMLYPFEDIFTIARTSEKIHIGVYMKTDFLNIATSLQDSDKYPHLDDKYVRTDVTNPAVIDPLQDSAILDKSSDGLVWKYNGNFVIAAFPLHDFSNTLVGSVLLAFDVTQQLGLMAKVQTQTGNANSSLLYTFILAFFTGIIIISIIISISVNRMIQPLASLSSMADSIAAGNFNLDSVHFKSKDEIGSLSRSFNMMVDSLQTKVQTISRIADRDLTGEIYKVSEQDRLGEVLIEMQDALHGVICNVNEAVEQVNQGADQIAVASESLSQGTTQQASSIEEISSTLVEISAQSKQNAEESLEADSLSRKTADAARAGSIKIVELNDAMKRINTSSDQIRTVVKVIDDIAFQINLLALNANVEAARAGKYGRGFSVVAEEVRNLANRSAEAVKQTTQMVEESVQNISEGTKAAEEMEVQLQEILKGVGSVAEVLQGIATSSKEQSTAIEQISEGLHQIEDVTQASTAGAEQTASISQELAGQAQGLREIVNQFIIDQGTCGGVATALLEEPDLPEKY